MSSAPGPPGLVEAIVGNGTVAASSCISCHAYASFGPDGAPTTRVKRMLPFNPTGKPIPGVLDGSHTFAFMNDHQRDRALADIARKVSVVSLRIRTRVLIFAADSRITRVRPWCERQATVAVTAAPVAQQFP